MQLDSSLFSTIICMVMIFALLSVLVSTLTEAINSYFQERSQLLFRTIGKLFEDGLNVNFGQLLYNHPMIDNLKKDNNSLPQYISDTTFSTAFIDVVNNYAREYKIVNDDLTTFERYRQGILKMGNTPLKLLLMNMTDKCIETNPENPLGELHKELQQWYNNQMERVSGWYKTWIRTRLFWISLFVAVLLNIDSIHLFQTIYRSPDLRARLEPIAEQLAVNYGNLAGDSTLTANERAMRATMATNFKKDSSHTDSFLLQVSRIVGQLEKLDSARMQRDTVLQKNQLKASQQIDNIMSLGIPLGWRKNMVPLSWFQEKPDEVLPGYFSNHLQLTFWNFLLYFAGIAITAFSLSAGAPFWFDLLLKLVNIRRSGAKPAESKN